MQNDSRAVYTTKEGLTEWFHSLDTNNYASFVNRRIQFAGYDGTIADEKDLLKAFYNDELGIDQHHSLNFKQPLPVKAVVDHYLYEFYQAMESVENDRNKKLELICQLIQRLERFHPLPDGNGRTFSMLLFNYLLITNGFYPALQTSPNRVDGLSVQQLMEQIQVDMAKSKLLLECRSNDEMLKLLHEIEEADASSPPGKPPVIQGEKGGAELPHQFDMTTHLSQKLGGLIENAQGKSIYPVIPVEKKSEILGNLSERPDQNHESMMTLLSTHEDIADRLNMLQGFSQNNKHPYLSQLLLESTKAPTTIELLSNLVYGSLGSAPVI